VVHVVEEHVERADALLEAPVDDAEVLGLDDPGDDVEREDPLLPLVVAVDVEGVPEIEQRRLGRLLPPEQLPLGQGLDSLDEQGRTRTRTQPFALEGLVVEALGVITVESQKRPPTRQTWSGDAPPKAGQVYQPGR
jgi:hypothetical protein